MKVIITGGRSYFLTSSDYAWLDAFHAKYGLTLVITGRAKGADTCADQWAERCGIDRINFPANWVGQGKSAGPRRNARMLHCLLWAGQEDFEAIGVIGFPGNRGTADMCRLARGGHITVHEPHRET